MHKEPIGADFLWVPKTADTGKSPQLQVAGTEYGVVIALPPGYAALPQGARPSAGWSVYVSHPSAGRQDLLDTATRLAVLPASQAQLTILGVTGGYALFAAQTAQGRMLELLTLSGARAGTLATIGSVAGSYSSALAVRGLVLWLDPRRTLHALFIASGREATAPLGSVPPGPLIWWQGGLVVGTRAVQIPGVQPPAAPVLPKGFAWISIGQSRAPIAAVPQAYRVKRLPGGSSHGVSATDPKNPSVQVTIYENACAGCYNPGFMAQGTNTLSTPIYVGRQPGVSPLGDHGFITEFRPKKGLETYMLVADYLDGGDIEASVTVPKAQAALAREILQTVRLPW